ncbi:Tat pathway signal sequence domain protein [Sphingomonas sp. FW199]|uniref:exo-rhamnogalacturonan lyase family protein n=1 Tax=Sphingomonas sp. FW199 TaxID=3400217 RepID=UPI003CF622ED
MNRRHLLKGAATLPVLTTGLGTVAAAATPGRTSSVGLRWIDGDPATAPHGATVGTAWPRGAVRRGSDFAVTAGGKGVPAQSWITATWPDGSVKWAAHAILPGNAAGPLSVAPGRPVRPARPLTLTEGPDHLAIDTGAAQWRIARSGDAMVQSASIDGRPVIGPVRLVGSNRTGSPDGAAAPLTGMIERVAVEQRGPVRAVIRVEGRHRGPDGRAWLPFVVRLYAYAGSAALRIVHSFIHDGDPARDFIASLGIEASVPMRDPLHDRHLRIATDGAPWAEAVRPLTGLRRDPGRAAREAQIAGRAAPPLAELSAAVRDRLDRIPAWGDVALEQPNANGFTIAKRTVPGHAWVPSAQGRRAPGLGYLGGASGGAAIGQRWFWQRHPSALHIADAATDTGRLTAWLWSPAAPAMDLRSYRGVLGMEAFDAQNEGLDITYEDYEPGFDTASGAARTSELTLWALAATPDAATFDAMADTVTTPPQLMAEPASLHAAGVFGDWSLPDRSTPRRAMIEDHLDRMLDFYADEVEHRSWYGFWDHGDVMHSYDDDRHQWRYDIGGFAWANSELSPDLWLWYAAMRSADPRAFRLAEAMTRHTGEVDVYHLGRFAGLGTRHGVQHFSDSSKQPRVSTAAYRRIFYYLTADERTGDLMRALLGSEERLADVVIERKVPGNKRETPPPGTVNMSFGTVWCSLAAAWLTEWERTGNRKWRDRLMAGMDSIGRMPAGWFAGGGFYHLETGRFLPREGQSISHLNAVFGAVEVNAEIIALIDVPRYRTAWLDYCRNYNLSGEAFRAATGRARSGSANLKQGHSRLTAYAARADRNPALADRAAAQFLGAEAGLPLANGDPRVTLAGGGAEWPGMSTNAASQFGLTAIQLLALVPDALDRADLPAPRRPRPRQ